MTTWQSCPQITQRRNKSWRQQLDQRELLSLWKETYLGARPEDEVIKSPVTCAATANVSVHLCARPVFVDVGPHTGNLDVSPVASQLAQHTKAVEPCRRYSACLPSYAISGLSGVEPGFR